MSFGNCQWRKKSENRRYLCPKPKFYLNKQKKNMSTKNIFKMYSPPRILYSSNRLTGQIFWKYSISIIQISDIGVKDLNYSQHQ